MVRRESREDVIEDIHQRLRMEREIDRDTVKLYFLALETLVKEGDEQAKVVHDYLMLTQLKAAEQRIDHDFKPANVVEWASNIHHNTWSSNGLGAKLKTRVTLMRIQGYK